MSWLWNPITLLLLIFVGSLAFFFKMYGLW
jgi:hypothetical protein